MKPDSGKLQRKLMYTLTCGGCGVGALIAEVTTYEAAAAAIRADGWREGKRGWVCAKCSAVPREFRPAKEGRS